MNSASRFALLTILFAFTTATDRKEVEFLCEGNKIPCSAYAKSCFDPQTENCHKVREGRTICPKEEKLCVLGEYSRNGQCYNSSTHDCLRYADNILWYGLVCEKEEKMCGAYNCYDPTTQDCNGDKVCNRKELLCNGQCYDPEVQQCSVAKLCKITDKACNGECYPSSQGKTCFRVRHNEGIYKEIKNYEKLW